MRAGRPAYHIRAKWITLMSPQGSLVYYELDKKGNLINKSSQLQPSLVCDLPLNINNSNNLNNVNNNNNDEIGNNKIENNNDEISLTRNDWNNQDIDEELDMFNILSNDNEIISKTEDYDDNQNNTVTHDNQSQTEPIFYGSDINIEDEIPIGDDSFFDDFGDQFFDPMNILQEDEEFPFNIY